MKRLLLAFLLLLPVAARAGDSPTVARKFEGLWQREDGLLVRIQKDSVDFSKDGERLTWSRQSCDTGALDRYNFGYATVKLSDMVAVGIPVAREGWKFPQTIPAFRSDCEESRIFWLATSDGKLVYLSLYENMYDAFVYRKVAP